MDLSQLAQSAGAALVEAMVGDGWQVVRDRVLGLFGRHMPGREPTVARQLDESRMLLLNGDITLQRHTAAALWQGRFEALLTQSPSAAPELSGIIAGILPQYVPIRQEQRFVQSPITARRGDITISQTGVDNSRTQNTFVSYVKSHRALTAVIVLVSVALVAGIVWFFSRDTGSGAASPAPDRSTPLGAASEFVDAVNARDASGIKAVSCDNRMVIDLEKLDPGAKAAVNSKPEEIGEFTVVRFVIFTEAGGRRDVTRDDQIHLRDLGGRWCVNDL